MNNTTSLPSSVAYDTWQRQLTQGKELNYVNTAMTAIVLIGYIAKYIIKHKCKKKKEIHLDQTSSLDMEALGGELREQLTQGLKDFLYNSLEPTPVIDDSKKVVRFDTKQRDEVIDLAKTEQVGDNARYRSYAKGTYYIDENGNEFIPKEGNLRK